MPSLPLSLSSSSSVSRAPASAPHERTGSESAGAFDRVLTNAVTSAAVEESKAQRQLAAQEAEAEQEEKRDEAQEEERQNLPPALAALAANIAASPNRLAWQGSVADADTQASAGALAGGLSPAATGVANIDAALNAMQAAGVMSLTQEALPATPALLDERFAAPAPPSAQASELTLLQNMLMAGRQLTTPATVAAPAAANADAFALDAGLPAVRVQLLEVGKEGGSHTVLKTVPADGSALGIDLKLDGQGNATLVLDVANDAEHLRLQQTLSALHAGFAAMGLALNVELRQGGDERQSAPVPELNRRAGMLRAVTDAGTAPVSRMGNSELAAAGSQIHFYA